MHNSYKTVVTLADDLHGSCSWPGKVKLDLDSVVKELLVPEDILELGVSIIIADLSSIVEVDEHGAIAMGDIQNLSLHLEQRALEIDAVKSFALLICNVLCIFSIRTKRSFPGCVKLFIAAELGTMWEHKTPNKLQFCHSSYHFFTSTQKLRE